MTSKVNMITNNVPQAAKEMPESDINTLYEIKYAHCPPSSAGTLMILMLLSALPETRRLVAGLNFNVVGGKSCALRIVRRG